jgi:hypothetical protein
MAQPQRASANALQHTTGTQGNQQIPMTYSSVTFNSSGQVVDTDLESHLRPNNVVHDSAKASINIQTRNSGGLHTFNSHSGNAQVAPAVTSVQMLERTGRVMVGGHSVTEEVAATLAETAPQLFKPEAEKLAEAAAAEADAAAAAAEEAAMNTHPDAFIEESHTQYTNDVPVGLQVELLVQMNRDGAPSKDTLNRVADALGVTVDDAVTRLNAMSAGVHPPKRPLSASMRLQRWDACVARAKRPSTWL